MKRETPDDPDLDEAPARRRVEVFCEVDDPPLEEEELRRIAAVASELAGAPELALNVVLLDDPSLAELHGRLFDDPTPTDVISVDLGDGEGEVYVSVDCARRVARSRGVRVERELALYVVHGTLHLCGHDDLDDDQRSEMRAAEERAMNTLGYEPDPNPHHWSGED